MEPLDAVGEWCRSLYPRQVDALTLHGFLDELLFRWPASVGLKTAVVCGAASVTFLQLQSLSKFMFRILCRQENGIKFTRIAIALDTSPLLVASVFAASRMGALCIPICKSWSTEKVVEVFRRTAPNLLVTDNPYTFAQATKCLERKLHVVDVNNAELLSTNIPSSASSSTKRVPISSCQDFVMIRSHDGDKESYTTYSHQNVLKKLTAEWYNLPWKHDEAGLLRSHYTSLDGFLELVGAVLAGHPLVIVPSTDNTANLVQPMIDFPIRRIRLTAEDLRAVCEDLVLQRTRSATLLEVVIVASGRVFLDVCLQFLILHPGLILALEDHATDESMVMIKNQRDLWEIIRRRENSLVVPCSFHMAISNTKEDEEEGEWIISGCFSNTNSDSVECKRTILKTRLTAEHPLNSCLNPEHESTGTQALLPDLTHATLVANQIVEDFQSNATIGLTSYFQERTELSCHLPLKPVSNNLVDKQQKLESFLKACARKRRMSFVLKNEVGVILAAIIASETGDYALKAEFAHVVGKEALEVVEWCHAPITLSLVGSTEKAVEVLSCTVDKDVSLPRRQAFVTALIKHLVTESRKSRFTRILWRISHVKNNEVACCGDFWILNLLRDSGFTKVSSVRLKAIAHPGLQLPFSTAPNTMKLSLFSLNI